jgi:nucleoside-diphosphate-sugar epimerase
MASSLCLIPGGAGFLGINLCRYLLKRGWTVRTLDIAPFDYPELERVEAVTGDIRDPQAVAQAVRDVDVVVHCAAALPLASRHDIMTTSVDGTRLLLEHAHRQGIERFVYISSTAVYGIPDHHPLIEQDPVHGVGPYGEAKIEAESLCARYRDATMCVPVLRPKTFVGPERLGAFELLYDWAYTGHHFPVLGRGANRYQLLDVEDLCRAIECAIGAPAARANDIFNIGAARFGTMRENFQSVLDRAGHGKRVIGLPARPAIAILRLLQALGLSPLYEWIYETATQDSFVSIERARQALGFEPRYSNEEALARNYEWYVAHRDAIGRAAGVSHRVAWKKGALALAKPLF